MDNHPAQSCQRNWELLQRMGWLWAWIRQSGGRVLVWAIKYSSPHYPRWCRAKDRSARWALQGDNVTWTYQEFKVDGPADKYRLRIGPGTGPPGNRDSMAHHNNQKFSTYDRDNDNLRTNCAVVTHGAWWYNGCFNANLNGPHELHSSSPSAQLFWLVGGTGGSGGQFKYFPNVEMKVRPKTCILIKKDCWSERQDCADDTLKLFMCN